MQSSLLTSSYNRRRGIVTTTDHRIFAIWIKIGMMMTTILFISRGRSQRIVSTKNSLLCSSFSVVQATTSYYSNNIVNPLHQQNDNFLRHHQFRNTIRSTTSSSFIRNRSALRKSSNNPLCFIGINDMSHRQYKQNVNSLSPLYYDTGAIQNRQYSSSIYHHSIKKHRMISLHQLSSTSTTSISDKADDNIENNVDNDSSFFFKDITFKQMGIKSKILLERLNINFPQIIKPTHIQVETWNALLSDNNNDNNFMIGAETGTGKTLSYLLPIVDDILQRKEYIQQLSFEQQLTLAQQQQDQGGILGYEYSRALILLPNKELVQQLVYILTLLSGGISSIAYPKNYGKSRNQIDINESNDQNDDNVDPFQTIRIGIVPGGYKDITNDLVSFRQYFASKTLLLKNKQLLPPIDILISTPAAIGPLQMNMKNMDFFNDIQTVIIDEADMLLDGGYIRPLQDVFIGFKRADKERRMLAREQKQQMQFQDDNDNISNNDESTIKEENKLVIHDDDDDWYNDMKRFDNDKTTTSMIPMTIIKKKNEKTQYIFVAATLPDYGLRSVDSYLYKKIPDIQKITTNVGMHNAKHYGLIQPTLWISESSKKKRMETLIQYLLPSSTTSTKTSSSSTNIELKTNSFPVFEDDDNKVDATATTLTSNDDNNNVVVEQHQNYNNDLSDQKVMIFLNSVDDVEEACSALNQLGKGQVLALPYHAKMSLDDRMDALEQFRLYDPSTSSSTTNNSFDDEIPIIVLVCSDLAARGIDIPDVTTIVQLQFATNVVIHLHRMGRCSRAGKRIGRGIIFYDPTIEKELVNVIQQAEENQMKQKHNDQNDTTSSKIRLQRDIESNFFDDNDKNDDNESQEDDGKIRKAFSRKRGFTKKLKKIRRELSAPSNSSYED